jgi:molecular chaperone GrpE (heat shock protein)
MAWQPGQSGNPDGGTRPKIWRDAINRAIKRREESDPQALEKLADALLRRVAEGDVAAIKEVGDRLDGKVTQLIAGDENHAPLAIIVTGVPRAGD